MPEYVSGLLIGLITFMYGAGKLLALYDYIQERKSKDSNDILYVPNKNKVKEMIKKLKRT